MNGIDRISTGSVKAMQAINKKPVYFLTMNGKTSPTITVKGENRSDGGSIAVRDISTELKWSGKLLKNIKDMEVEPVVMDPTEVFIFKTRARELFKGESGKQLPLTISGLTWVKLPYVKGMTESDLFSRNKENDWETRGKGVKKMFKKFSDPKTWIGLGRVMALDIFDGNLAQFNSNGSWINNGKDMFHKISKGIKVVGLDTFDVKNVPNAHLNKPVTPQVRSQLDLLISDIKMREFAKTITTEIAEHILHAMSKVVGGGIDDFVVIAGGRKITISRKGPADFFDAYIDDLCLGLTTTRDEIKRHLLEKVWQYETQWKTASRSVTAMRGAKATNSAPANFVANPCVKIVPQSIKDRMRYCGWIN